MQYINRSQHWTYNDSFPPRSAHYIRDQRRSEETPSAAPPQISSCSTRSSSVDTVYTVEEVSRYRASPSHSTVYPKQRVARTACVHGKRSVPEETWVSVLFPGVFIPGGLQGPEMNQTASVSHQVKCQSTKSIKVGSDVRCMCVCVCFTPRIPARVRSLCALERNTLDLFRGMCYYGDHRVRQHTQTCQRTMLLLKLYSVAHMLRFIVS